MTLLFALVSIAYASETKLFVDPPSKNVVIDNQFTINVSVADVDNLAGYEFKLYWKKDILNATSVIETPPEVWEGNWSAWGPGIENDFNETHGRYYKGVTSQLPAPLFNGSTTLTKITFKAIELGQTDLILKDTGLSDSLGQPISHIKINGTVNVTSQSVGGIQFPVNKPLLILHLVASYAPYIVLIATIAIVSVIIFVKRKKGKV